jgi:hypothetical protein
MRIVRIISSVAVAIGLVAVAAPGAQAKALPAINVHVAAQATAGQPFNFTYSHGTLPNGDKVLIQRQIGTSGWKTVATATAKSGRGKVPGLQLGSYWVRIALFDKHGKGLKSVKRLVKVYGVIPLSATCNQGAAIVGCYPATVTVGTHVFSAVGSLVTGPSSYTASSIARSTCRHVHLDLTFLINIRGDGPDETASVTLAQEKLDAVVTTVTQQDIAALDAPLDGGAFSLTTLTDEGWTGQIYANGWLSCYSRTGA